MSGTAQPPTQTTTTTTAPVSQIPKPKVYTSATDSAKSVTDSLLSVKNTLQSNKGNQLISKLFSHISNQKMEWASNLRMPKFHLGLHLF